VRRLFSTFAHGPPGAGLLLMRAVAGGALIVQAVLALLGGPALGPLLMQVLSIVLGLLLLAGLWTPIIGTLVAIEGLWGAVALGRPWRWVLLATLGAALALIGPGAWSVDSWLFGWRRLEIRDRKR